MQTSVKFNIAAYWDRRYREGRDSGEGSRGENATAKARTVSYFIEKYRIKSVIDWGCGDGQVLEHIDTNGIAYLGVDVSPTIINRMREKFPHLNFMSVNPGITSADMSLSMDVLFHLINDEDYFGYLDRAFDSARKAVLIYSTNYAGGRTARHVLRREFTPDVAQRFPNWKCVLSPDSGSEPGFYLYLPR